MKLFTILCAAVCISTSAIAQNLLMGQHAIDESRYEGIERGPYLFQEFAKGVATNTEKGETVEYLLNYNGHSKEFEFMYKDVKSEMDAAYYDVIEVANYTPSEHYDNKYATPTIKFVRGLDPKAPKAFSIVVYEDDNVTLYKSFKADISEREFNDPSKGLVQIQSFNPDFRYFVKTDGKTKVVGLNKKKVANGLAHSKIESYIKKNKLKVKTEDELVQVVTYYSELKSLEAGNTSPVASAN